MNKTQGRTHHQPLGGNQMPRFGGPATMMRLPSVPSAAGLDACFVGVPFDIGTSNRAGARFGPRVFRAESGRSRRSHMATRANPSKCALKALTSNWFSQWPMPASLCLRRP